MDILEAYTEIFAGLILLLASVSILFVNIIDPAFQQIEINYNARADKAATFTVSLNEGQGVHDQRVGRTPGIDPDVGYNDKDSGMSRMYFRPEQFIMLPAVDTDISSNPNVPLYTRKVAVSNNYNVIGTLGNDAEHRGLVIGHDSFQVDFDYRITRESLYDKQETYDSITYPGLSTQMRGLAVYPKVTFGTQCDVATQAPQGCTAIPTLHGGFNLTVDSTIDPVSKKHSNSVIFVTGRVPSK